MADEELTDLIHAVTNHFDLSDYEIEAYLTVIQRGSITASDLADQTSIPQPRVYDTVRSLSERQLVELHESRPMKVVAIDPAEAFDSLSESFETMVDRLRASYVAPQPDTYAVSLVKSRTTILRHLERIIENAEYELMLSLTPRLISQFQEPLREAYLRGVTTELLVTPAEQAPPPSRYPYLDVATAVRGRRGITTPVTAVADGEHSLYATQDAIRNDDDRYGVLFNQSELGFLIAGFFGTVLWVTADPIVQDGGPMSLPRKYASIRRCIKDLQLIESTVQAQIEGRWVQSGDTCHMSGIVTEASIDESQQLATMKIETDTDEYLVGGRLAAIEDIESHEIIISELNPTSE